MPVPKGESSKLSLHLWSGDIWTPWGTWIPCFVGCSGPLVLNQCSIPWLDGPCDMSWLLSLAQPPWFRLCIKLIRKQWKVTAPTYYLVFLIFSCIQWMPSWNPFCACVHPSHDSVQEQGVHREAGVTSSFFLLLKLFSLVMVIKGKEREHINHFSEHSIYTTWFIRWS